MLRAIRAHGTLTKADLARQTGLAHPTVTNIVKRLMARGSSSSFSSVLL